MPSPRLCLSVVLLVLALCPLACPQGGTSAGLGLPAHARPSKKLIALGVNGDPAAFLARHNLVQYRSLTVRDVLQPHRVIILEKTDEADMEDLQRSLSALDDVLYCRPVREIPGSEHRAILTNDVCVGLSLQLDPMAWAQEHGAVLLHRFAHAGTYLLRLNPSSSLDPLHFCASVAGRPGVRFAHPDWLRSLPTRETVPNDPLFPQQWHLKNVGQTSGPAGIDIRATHAWDLTTGSPNVVIAVIDNGVEPSHTDLRLLPLGFNPLCGAGPTMGAPTPTGCGIGFYAGNHGTQVAGLAAGRINNGMGVSGVAGDCSILAINLLGAGLGFGTPSMEAMAFDHAVLAGAAVINNSWGPDGIPWPLPALVEASFINASVNGRGGLGTVIVWAAGNGSESIMTDGYASSPYTLAVGAVTNYGLHASYSDFGDAVEVVAPSSGGSASLLTTSTNIQGLSLYNNSFGGTSAAAAQATGVVALMLSINPLLTADQVRALLRSTATSIDASNVPGAPNYYDPVTGHSPWYGHGLLDAHAAVLAAIAEPPGLLLSLTTSGQGDGQISVSRGFPGAELFLPISLQTQDAIGSGPLIGIGIDALPWLFLPLHAAPAHVLMDATGTYNFQLPVGSLPPGLTLDMAALALRWSPFEFRVSSARRVTF